MPDGLKTQAERARPRLTRLEYGYNRRSRPVRVSREQQNNSPRGIPRPSLPPAGMLRPEIRFLRSPGGRGPGKTPGPLFQHPPRRSTLTPVDPSRQDGEGVRRRSGATWSSGQLVGFITRRPRVRVPPSHPVFAARLPPWAAARGPPGADPGTYIPAGFDLRARGRNAPAFSPPLQPPLRADLAGATLRPFLHVERAPGGALVAVKDSLSAPGESDRFRHHISLRASALDGQFGDAGMHGVLYAVGAPPERV